MRRREFIRGLGIGTLATFGLSTSRMSARDACSRVSGAGSYQLGPFEPLQAGSDQVFLLTDLGFDETMVFCKITTNFAGLRFATAKMGIVELGPHEFYMDMRSVEIASLEIQTGDDGPHAVYTGALNSETRLFSGEATRTIAEKEILFGCDVLAMGPEAAVDISKTNFAMTIHFDPNKEHAAIFGENPTFSGRLTQGNIVVIA
jgi:hypothetical protein